MQGEYSCCFRISALSTAKTLFYITAASAKPIDVIDCEVGNETVETNEQLVMCWQKVTTLGTPTATTITPSKKTANTQAASGTYKANVTASEPTYGAIAADAAIVDVHALKGFASLAGYHFTPMDPFTIASAETWGLRILTAPTALAVDIKIVTRET